MIIQINELKGTTCSYKIDNCKNEFIAEYFINDFKSINNYIFIGRKKKKKKLG